MKSRCAIAHNIPISLIALTLGGCALLPEKFTIPPQLPNPFARQSPRIANQRTQIQPNAPQQTATCVTRTYFANVTQTQSLPNVAVGRRPAEVLLNSPAEVSRDTLGNIIYTNRRGGTETSVRFDRSGGCNIKVYGFTGNLTADETGQATGIASNNDQNYQTGYNQGYQQGYQDGRNAQNYNYGYNPNTVAQAGNYNSNSSYDRGYNDGYSRGYQDGYYGGGGYPPVGPVLW